MADVSIKYKGSTIPASEMSASGTKTCKTAGKYCEADIVIEYTKPEAPSGEIASNITISPYSTGVPLIATSGVINQTDISGITVESNKTLSNLYADGGTVSTIFNGYNNNNGIITSLNNGTRMSGLISTLTNGVSGTISNLQNESGTITKLKNEGTIDILTGEGTISSIKEGADQYITDLGYNNSSLGNLYIKRINGKTGTSYGNVYIGTDITGASSSGASMKIYNQMYSSTEASDYLCVDVNSGKHLMYLYNKNGSISVVSNQGAAAGTSTISTLTNGAATSGYLGVITSLNNNANGTINKLNNAGIIGDSTSSTSSSTGQNGLYGTGTVYLAATGVSSPSNSSTYALNNITLKGGNSTYKGAYLYTLNMNQYSTINSLNTGNYCNINSIRINQYSTIGTLSNYRGTITTISNLYGGGAGDCYIGTIENAYASASSSSMTGTINLINNNIYGKINKIKNTGTIGDIEESSSSSTGLNGLYGSGIVYVSATGVSNPSSSSTYALNNIVLKGGTSSYKGAYVDLLNVEPYAQINTLQMAQASKIQSLTCADGEITSLANSGTISTLTNTGTIGSSSYTGSNSGSIYINNAEDDGNIYIKCAGYTSGTQVVTDGSPYYAAFSGQSSSSGTIQTTITPYSATSISYQKITRGGMFCTNDSIKVLPSFRKMSYGTKLHGRIATSNLTTSQTSYVFTGTTSNLPWTTSYKALGYFSASSGSITALYDSAGNSITTPVVFGYKIYSSASTSTSNNTSLTFSTTLIYIGFSNGRIYFLTGSTGYFYSDSAAVGYSYIVPINEFCFKQTVASNSTFTFTALASLYTNYTRYGHIYQGTSGASTTTYFYVPYDENASASYYKKITYVSIYGSTAANLIGTLATGALSTA